MIDVVRWWLALQLLGMAALPATLLLFRRLPDRGVFFARTAGLLFPTYLIWLLGSLHVVPYTAWSLPVAALVMFAAGTFASVRLRRPWWREVQELWRCQRGRLVVGEVIFTLWYVGWCWVRSYTPDIDGTEKFMDFAFLNAINRSAYFPPYDPWLSGAVINYYYFGHLMFGALIRATGVAATVGFNLAVPAIAGLVATGIYSIVSNLVTLDAGRDADQATAQRAPMVVGSIAAIACTVFGNLDGARQLLAAPGTWRDFNWWTPSRVIVNTINEFPFFSFLRADLHAHVMAVPVGLLVIGLALEFAVTPWAELSWTRKATVGASRTTTDELEAVPTRVRRHPAAVGIVASAAAPTIPAWAGRWLFLFAVAAVSLGSLYVLNGWDYPAYAAVLVLPILARTLRAPDDDFAQRPQPVLGWCAALAVASVATIVPFLLVFRAPASGVGLVAASSDIVPFVTIYGLFAVAICVWLGVVALRAYTIPWRDLVVGGTAILMVSVLVNGAVLDVQYGVMAVGIVAFLVMARRETGDADRFAAGLVLIACLLLTAAEVVYLKDSFAGSPERRMNTVFKFGYVAWFLLSAGAGYALYAGWKLLQREARQVWVACLVLLEAASLVYPIFATYSKSGHFDRQVGLDGLQYMTDRPVRACIPNNERQLSAVGDAAAIRWMQRHVRGNPVILEAVGGEYSECARFSTFTGLPTVVGWEGHEGQWKHDTGSRGADVTRIYETTDSNVARALLQKYGVRYVVVGAQEHARFATGLGKFATMGKAVFDAQGTQIYDLGP